MGEICVYAIKAALCLAVMYVPYMLMLRSETFFRFNRVVLLSIVALSFVLPLLNIAPMAFLDQTEMGVAGRAISNVGVPIVEIGLPTAELADDNTDATVMLHLGWADVVVAIYLIGVAVALAVKLVQLVKMLVFMRKGCLWTSEEDGVKVYCHIRDVVPFSWMKNIVISERDWDESGREIVMHEKAHIRCGHSVDVCLVALCEVLQWFNPFAWLLASSLSDVHEYEADADVLRGGVDARSYQMLLIKKAVGSSSYAFANSLNHSLLKKRIAMMMKKKSSPWMRAKALCVIPMAAFALSAFATAEFSESAELINEGKVSNLVAADQKAADLPVADDKKDGKPIFVVEGKIVEVNGLAENETLSNDRLAELLGVKPSDIAHLTVLKGVSATAIYGEKGKHGAIVIETKAYAEAKSKAIEEADEGEVFMVCEQMPEYPGGMGELMKFIASNIRYPKLAQEYGVKGRVVVNFVVEKDGTTSEHKIVESKIVRFANSADSLRLNGIELSEIVVNAMQMDQSDDPNTLSMNELKKLVARIPGAEMDEEGNVTINGKSVKTLKVEGKDYNIDQSMVAYQNARIALENEAIRVVKAMPAWKSGMQRGKAVRVRFNIPITYRLQ